MKRQKYYCPVEVTVEVMGGKWKSRILWHLSHQNYRYGQLKALIPEVSRKMLTQALRELEEDGLLIRNIYNEKIPRVEYELTDYARTLVPILTLMSEWGKSHMREMEEGPTFTALKQ